MQPLVGGRAPEILGDIFVGHVIDAVFIYDCLSEFLSSLPLVIFKNSTNIIIFIHIPQNALDMIENRFVKHLRNGFSVTVIRFLMQVICDRKTIRR